MDVEDQKNQIYLILIFKINYIYIFNLFSECNSLKKIDISNFNIIKIKSLNNMYNGCHSLKKSNILTKEDRVIKQFLINN